MFSALPPNSDVARCSWHFAFVPGADQALSQLLQLPRDKCAARMSAAKSASGAVKSVPDVATLILATLTGAVGCRRIHRSSASPLRRPPTQRDVPNLDSETSPW